jgi:hypothetical protein
MGAHAFASFPRNADAVVFLGGLASGGASGVGDTLDMIHALIMTECHPDIKH